jgi:L-iditol 2-dehydrogenase
MKVARFYAPGDVRLEDMDEPTPGADEVKIRVRNCSTCGTDVKIFNNGHPNMTPPQVMGHEIAGEVVEVGSDVSGWSVGDGVQVIAAIPDGTCEECRRGRLTVCTNQTSMGYQYPGGFAEYMIVPRAVLAVDGLNRIPQGLSFAEASVAEPFACVLNGQELAGVGDGTTSWSSVRARSAACTSGWPGRAGRSGCSSSTSTAGGWTCPRVRSTPTPRSAVPRSTRSTR